MGTLAAVAKPLTLVSGYLGSGKTTLINRVLASGSLGRTAVVVNDFGTINIDAALIRSSGADTIELTNGCICCQISDDVQRTMGALAKRDDLDHVVCEVSGIGNPAQLGAWRTYPGFRPGGVVVCVDAESTVKRLRDEYVADIVRAQIAAADLLAVTKAAEAGPPQVSQTVKACASIAGEVPVEIVQDGEWDPVLRAVEGAAIASRGGLPSKDATAHAEVHSTATVQVPRPSDIERIVEVLRSHAVQLVRAKGILQDQAGAWIAVQLAGGTVTSERVQVAPRAESSSGPSDTSGSSAIILIAAGPDADEALERAAQDLAG